MGIEIPAGLQWVSYLAGEQWPKGDETAMFQLGDDWNGASGQLSGLIASVQQVQSQTASAVSGQTAGAVAGQFASLLSGDSSMAALVSSMSALGSLATNTGTQIQYTKLQILTSLGIAAAEIAYALSAVEWTFGASLAWIPPVEAITMAVVRTLVSQLIKRLLAALAETLTKTGIKALVKDAAVGAAVGTGIGLVQDVAIQAYQVHEGVRSGIDWKQTLEVSVGAVVGGAVGSVAHGLLSKSLGESTNIGAKVLKGTVTHFGVGTVGNVAGAGAAGGGLDAEDIFGGAGGGAISGGAHGASKHPESEAHGESSEEKSESTQASSTPDDDHEGLLSDKPLTSVNSSDPVSKPSIPGDGPKNLTNGHESPVGDNPPGSTSLEGGGVSSPALGASQASPDRGGQTSTTDSSAPAAAASSSTGESSPASPGRGGETSTTDSSAPAAAASSSTGESSANQGESLFSDNRSGATGSGQQEERPAAALSDNQAAAAKSSSAAFGEAAPLAQQGSAARGSLSDVAGASRPATASSAGSAPDGRPESRPQQARPTLTAPRALPGPGQPNQRPRRLLAPRCRDRRRWRGRPITLRRSLLDNHQPMVSTRPTKDDSSAHRRWTIPLVRQGWIRRQGCLMVCRLMIRRRRSTRCKTGTVRPQHRTPSPGRRSLPSRRQTPHARTRCPARAPGTNLRRVTPKRRKGYLTGSPGALILGSQRD